MNMRRARLIPWSHRMVLLTAMIAAFGVIAFLSMRAFRSHTIALAQSQLVQASQELANRARHRHDLIRTYQFQEEQHIIFRLDAISDLIAAISRQLELFSARRLIAPSDAKKLVIEILSSGDFGRSSYGYAITTAGRVVYHPNLPEGFDLSHYRFAREMIEKESGVIRYEWKSPGEFEQRQRVISYRTVYSWNWIIAVGVPIGDVVDNSIEAQHLKGFFESVKAIQLPWRGKAAVYSEDGTVLAHPFYETLNAGEVDGALSIIKTGNGLCRFTDSLGRNWWASGTVFSPRKWIIATFAREDEILGEYHRFRNKMLIGTVSVLLGLILIQVVWTRKLVMKVVKKLRKPVTSGEATPE
ncbi:cache domain-containing protein [bacterium]|nr:cache domain-containing protein [candidate division CSSED10-310 bacterium]